MLAHTVYIVRSRATAEGNGTSNIQHAQLSALQKKDTDTKYPGGQLKCS